MKSSHIIVGLSGGVDSSVAAFLLKEAGHHVEGIFMKNWEEDNPIYCTIKQDLDDAQAVCDRLQINLHVVNFADLYWEHVFTHFLESYQAGLTPNPDILCNKEIKFKAFLDYAKQRGADYIATGHYVRSQQLEQGMQLCKGLDPQKDQSYFLYTLNQAQLASSLFPLGHLSKKQVRAIAAHIGLNNHGKKDSTGICFIGERKFKAFLNDYLPAQPGSIETIDGETIGHHDGLMFYTMGQRQGLRIGGQKGRAELPWYVVDKDLKRKVLIVVQGEHPALYKTSLIATSFHWIHTPPTLYNSISAKIRYRQIDQACTIKWIDEDHGLVTFVTPQRAVTPGQSIVFYANEICLGGGIISSANL